MSLAIPMPERPRRARGRLQLLAIIGLVVGPMLLASAMYKWSFWVPQGRSYSCLLYTSVVGFLAGSPLQVSGPAAGLAVLVFELVRTYGVAMLGPILLLAGAIQLLAGRLRLGCW